MNNYPMQPYGAQNSNIQPYYNRYTGRMQGCIIVNLVSSVREAEAFPPDQSGNPTFFYNIGQNEIYMKQFNNTGAAPLLIYKCSGEYTPSDSSSPVIMDYERQFQELNGKIDNVAAMLQHNMQGYQQQMNEQPQQAKQIQQGGRNGK